MRKQEHVVMDEVIPNNLIEKPDDVEYSLHRLERITWLIRSLGLVVALITAVNLVLQALILLRFPSYSNPLSTFLMLSIASTFCVFINVVFYESMRKRGDSLFEEISDELQWNVRRERSAATSIANERPVLHARIILRSFARASDLPLVPGKFGPAVYVTFNIVILLAGPYLSQVFALH